MNNRQYEAQTQPPNAHTVSTLRVADMLLPLGIGPMHDPWFDPPAGGGPPVNNSADEPDKVHGGFLCLSEALATAVGYSTPPPVADGPFQPYYKIGDPVVGALDRGALVLDRFSCFQRGSTAAIPPGTLPAFNPAQDEVRSPGIPLALNVFNVFSTAGSEFGGLTRAVPGLVNINTAPTEVLRGFGILSPTTEGMGTGTAIWSTWLTDSHDPIANLTLPDLSTDVAPALVALRDRSNYWTRDHQVVSFADGTGADPFDPATWNGRYSINKIEGISEAPGLRGVGAIMTAIDRTVPASGNNPPQPGTAIPITSQIDYLGNERIQTGTAHTSKTAGIASTLYPDANSATTLSRPDAIPDSWFEKLELAAAVMNGMTVRSDVFACWFVLHGYQRSDCENLGVNDPLVPSVAKRYLMVIDRSNVTHRGEKPKVLLFMELPLN